jgi:hypothetical protein
LKRLKDHELFFLVGFYIIINPDHAVRTRVGWLFNTSFERMDRCFNALIDAGVIADFVKSGGLPFKVLMGLDMFIRLCFDMELTRLQDYIPPSTPMISNK